MKKIAASLLVFVPLLSFARFERWFEDKTMRFDYYHCGDAESEEYYFSALRQEPFWGGSRVSLIDENGYGNQLFKIVDAATGEVIYSRGFCTLWNEWQTTAEARLLRKGMPESVVFPFPKDDVRIEIYSRERSGRFVKKFEQHISPRSRFISNYPPRYDTFEVEVNGPAACRVDVVLLPEGYDDSEREKFEEACRYFAESLFSFEPYGELRDRFNIRAVWVPSPRSGVSVPGAGVWKNSSAGAAFWTFDSERYQMTDNFTALRDQAGHVPYDLIYVLSNSDKYGGGGIYNFYGLSSAHHPTSTAKVYIHEFGHLLLGLGDEYTGGVSYEESLLYPLDREPWEVNLTTLVDFESKEWSGMLLSGTPVPTPLEGSDAERLGVYQGGGYVSRGIYRPWPNCLMNSLRKTDKFCPVCQRGIRNQIEFLCR